ncbi:MAG: hypothetical protein EOM51_08895 [Clostridia bacterium]|nr:hypothetical protein [Clostridia bacterium]
MLTGLYSLTHFLVDFTCAYLIFFRLRGSDFWLVSLITYNFFAFAMQMPLGVVADAVNHNRLFACIGCLMIILSPFLIEVPILFCGVLGSGNALFHIGAGRDVLLRSGKSYTALGLFVSPGAIGLFLGTLCGISEILPQYAVLSLLFADAAALYILIPKLRTKLSAESEAVLVPKRPFRDFSIMLICLILVVCLRSYVGATLTFPWKSEGSFALFLVISVVMGKAAGGFLADHFGALKTVFASLLLSSVLFLFYKTPICGIIAVFLFNMSMPITLGAVRQLMPQRLGFGFGLLTFGLFLGIVPVFLNFNKLLVMPYGYTLAAVISSGLLYYGLKEQSHAA